MQTPLVSIIIPTYNRAHLIEETLDSVLAQTYTNWECIVVDDGSTDHTDQVLAAYCNKDARFQYHHRPKDRLPGGNAARNYGFELSKGEYIQWFDSDDIMLENNLKLKILIILEYNVDFVIAETCFLETKKKVNTNYNFIEEEINFLSFSTTSISWYTPAALLSKIIASKISFNEKLRGGQEYNYFCKLLLLTNNLKIIKNKLILIRDTPNSIGNNRKNNNVKYLKSRFNIYWVNYLDIYKKSKNIKFDKHSLITCISCYLRLNNDIRLPEDFNKHLIRVFGWKFMYFYLAIFTKYFFNKYHFFYLKLK